MNITESLDFINEIEDNYPVDKWTIDSVHIWPIVRLEIYFHFRDEMVMTMKPSYFRLLYKMRPAINFCRSILGILKYFYAFISDNKHNSRPNIADYIFLGDQVSRIPINGKWYDRLCEPIINNLRSLNKTSFHMDPHYKFRIPRNNASMFIQAHLDLLRIRSMLFPKNTDKATTSLENFDSFLELLATKNIHFISYAKIQGKVATIRTWSEYFKDILKTVRPSKAFVVEYNNIVGMAFTLACHENKIEIIEIPHGNHGELNIGYGRWNNVPKNGYELLPSVFWCWSEVEEHIIKKWAKAAPEAHKTFVGGNPWLDLWKEGTVDFIADYDREIMNLKKSKSAKIHILVAYEFDFDGLIKLIKASPSDWHWWIRIHPIKLAERGSIKRLLQNNNVENFTIKEATDFPLYALLKHVDIHITETSSVVIEAELFGVPSVITTTYGTEAFPNQVSSGWTLPAYDQEDIIKAIFTQYEKRNELQASSIPKVEPFDPVNFEQIL